MVATISLGSHTVIDIHHYLSSSPSPPMTAVSGAIAAVPLAHLLVLPRSLLVLSASLYTTHLHGISPLSSDIVTESEEGDGVRVANVGLLGNETVTGAICEGSWQGERQVRTSLTFRKAERVLKGGLFSMTGGGVRRL
jgi:alkylated DNA repair protein alkB family protein 6